MSFPKKFLSSSVLSVFDQGMLSALNFLVNMLLVRLVSKEEYGLYGQLYAGGLLAGLVVDALIAGPLTTVASAAQATARRALLRLYWRRQLAWSGLMAVTALAALWLVPALSGPAPQRWLLGAAFAAYVLGNGLREYGRTVGFIQSELRAVLRQDLLYVLLVTVGLGALYAGGRVALTALFACLAASSLLCAALAVRRLPPSAAEAEALDGHHAEIHAHGRWAVLGVVVGWLSNYSYVYLSGAWLGVAAIADLNAARLLLMPIPLAVAAWSRVARPEASRLMAEHNWSGLRRLTLFSIGAIELVVLAYVGLLLLALPWLEAHLIGAKYRGLDTLLLLWGVYFAVNAARWVGTAWLSSGGAFRSMFFLGSVTLVLVLLITTLSIPRWGAAGAILALIAVELFELVAVWKFILPALQRRR